MIRATGAILIAILSVDRNNILEQISKLTAAAFLIARSHDTNTLIIVGTATEKNEKVQIAWQAVFEDLLNAAKLNVELHAEVIRITPAGRAVALEWKAAVGATEE